MSAPNGWRYGTVLRRVLTPNVIVMVVGHEDNRTAPPPRLAGTIMTTLADPDGAWSDGYYSPGNAWKWLDWLRDEWEPVDG